MKRRLGGMILIIIVLATCLGCGSRRLLQNGNNTKQIIERIRHFDNLVKNGVLKYKRILKHYSAGGQETPEESSVIEIDMRFTLIEAEKLIANVSVGRQMVLTTIYDGENDFCWERIGKEGATIECPSLGVMFKNPLSHYVRCMSTYVNERNVVNISKIVVPGKTVLYNIEAVADIGYNEIDEFKPLYSYSGQSYLEKGTRIQLTVDSQKQFLPKQVILHDKTGYLTGEFLVESYQITDNGFWFPKKMTRRYYDKGEKFLEVIYEFDKVQLNCNVSLDIIDIPLPVGLTIQDERESLPLGLPQGTEYEILKPITYDELKDPQTALQTGKLKIIK